MNYMALNSMLHREACYTELLDAPDSNRVLRYVVRERSMSTKKILLGIMFHKDITMLNQ